MAQWGLESGSMNFDSRSSCSSAQTVAQVAHERGDTCQEAAQRKGVKLYNKMKPPGAMWNTLCIRLHRSFFEEKTNELGRWFGPLGTVWTQRNIRRRSRQGSSSRSTKCFHVPTTTCVGSLSPHPIWFLQCRVIYHRRFEAGHGFILNIHCPPESSS